MVRMPSPSWMLLFWCGLVAALASEWLAAFVRSLRPRPKLDRAGPRLMNKPRGSVPIAVAAGTFVFAPLYGLLFESVSRADLLTGSLIGAAHGSLTAVFVLLSWLRRRTGNGPPLRPIIYYRAGRLLTRIAYGALLGFLYVVPGH
jgi:hypothetical protein